MSQNEHTRFMMQAIHLAKKAYGLTSPNPAVGAVLVNNGKIIGKGFHRKAGTPHAEIEAIQDALNRKANIRKSSLYVTLEPCSTTGRTPPCVGAILKHGISKVFLGCIDPNPAHRGKGINILKFKGVKVLTGVLEDECQALIKMWRHWITKKTPYVIAKCAMTIDGKIATSKGESKWITSDQSRKAAHELRWSVDAILVGIETILKDNPALTARTGKQHENEKRLWKIILDSNARTPISSKIFASGKVWIFTTAKASRVKIQKLEKAGAMVSISPTQKTGIDLGFIMKELASREITSLLVEGGGKTLGSFFIQKKVNEIHFYLAPKVIGGALAKRAVEGPGFPNWKNSLPLQNMTIRKISSDIEIKADILDAGL